MALPSHRSSSPSMVAGRTSPNSRNSEIGSPIRRSFSGNPFPKPSIIANPRSLNPTTLANSPSDYPGRNSVSIENLYTRDNEEKENEKDQSQKPVRFRSPTVGKSIKHFMSPTISAASKFIASPKKKILGDRNNDQVRLSLSFSGSKSSSLNSLNQNPEALSAFDYDTNPQITLIPNSKSSKTVRFGGVEVISCSNDDSESAYRYDPEVITIADGPNTKPEIAPISKSAIETAPPETSKTAEFVDVEVISISTNDIESPAKGNFAEDIDCVNIDPSFKISPVSSPMEVASLDADPLMAPPYDPKTNYLSPRPQFLHYKPRRINQHELDGGLEELFSSTNVSESEFIEDPQMEFDEADNESQIEEEEEEEESEDEEEEEEENVNVSEQSPVGAKNSSKLHFSRMFKISSLLLILFTACFSICVVNVHDPNILERASLLTMEDSTAIFEFARTNFDVLVGKLEIWHENSKSFVSNMIFNIRGRPLIYLNQTEFLLKDVNPDGQCVLISHQILWEKDNNLNVMEEAMKEKEIDTFEDHNEEEQEQESLQEIEAMKERKINIEPVERDAQNEEEQMFHEIEKAMMEKEIEEVHNEEEQESVQEIEAMKDSKINGESVERNAQNDEEEQLFNEMEDKANDPKDIEESLQEIIEDTSANSSSDELNEEEHIQEKQTEDHYEVSSSPNFKIHDQIQQEPATLGETEEEQTDSIQQKNNMEFQYQSPPISPPSEPQSDVEDKKGGNVDLIEVATDDEISRDFTQNTAVIVSAMLLGSSLIAGLIYTRKSGPRPSMVATATTEEQKEQPLLKEKKTNESPMVQEEEEPIDDDHDDQSCSYETSSFQYSSMREDEPESPKRSSEAQRHSHGRKMRKISRRESMASSSLDEYSVSISASPSYGSFTTYEKIPIKHGNGDEEIVTPVRRSSRIRKAIQQ